MKTTQLGEDKARIPSFTHSIQYIFYFSNVLCLHPFTTFVFQAHYLFQTTITIFLTSFPALPLNISYLSPTYGFDHARLLKNLCHLLHTHARSLLLTPSSFIFSLSLSLKLLSQVFKSLQSLIINVSPTPDSLSHQPTYRLWSNHSNLLYIQIHSESFQLCLCLSYSLVLESPLHIIICQSSTQVLQV